MPIIPDASNTLIPPKPPNDEIVLKLEEINKWSKDRRNQYDQFVNQLDQLWHDIDDDKLDKTGEWYKAIKKVKDDNPKPENLDTLQTEVNELIRLENE